MKKSDTIEFNGESHTLGEWCKKIGMSVNGVNDRFRRGWSVEEALSKPPNRIIVSKPPKKPRPDKNCKGCDHSMVVWMDDMGLYYACDYLNRVGKRRPCEYGEGCTVKLKKKRGKASASKL